MKDDNKKITGYRELSEAEITLINEIKQKGEELGELCNRLNRNTGTDARWVSIGRTHLQQGVMALVRSVARPEGF